jgi:hypothetical protein
VVIHPLTDARRSVPLEKHNEIIAAHPDFQLTISSSCPHVIGRLSELDFRFVRR